MGGKGFEYESPEQIFREITELTPSYAGITYERLEQNTLQWPCPTPKTSRYGNTAYQDVLPRGKGFLQPLEYRPPAEMPDSEYPLVLTTNRSLFHYHTTGTMTRKVKDSTRSAEKSLLLSVRRTRRNSVSWTVTGYR